MDKLRIQCQCHSLLHQMQWEEWEGDKYVSFLTEPKGWKQRLQNAWRSLTGNSVEQAEIAVSQRDAQRLAKWLTACDPDVTLPPV